MDKRLYAIALVVLAIGAGYFFLNQSNPAPDLTDSHGHDHSEETPLYSFSPDSEVRYIVQKKFFDKPHQMITGVNTALSGGIYQEEDDSVILHASVSEKNFVSGSAKRDQDIAVLLRGPIDIESEVISEALAKTMQGPFAGTLPLKVTINNTTTVVNFTINAQMDSETIVATGSGNVKVSDFGLKAPSLLNVYEVDDALKLEFNIKLTR